MKNTTNNKIKILHLEDLPSDAELVERRIKKGNLNFEKLVVDNKTDFKNALKYFSPDIILSDHTLPTFNSVEALMMIKDLGLKIPFILITGTVSEEFAVEVMRLGADDYILKDHLQRLPNAMINAIEKNIAEKEKQIASEKLVKTNRLYAFISQINQTIVHIKDENELILKSCNIAIKCGKFKMAWIGMLDITTNKIEPVGLSAIPDEAIKLFQKLSYIKNRPQEQVLSNNNYYTCNDISKNPELKEWKTIAEKNGIQSIMVLPIRKGENIIGTFNLYSTELNFFDTEEINLLVEVTNDISFALDLLEKIKKQKETEALILKNEQRFRALIEKSSDMISLSTKQGEMIYVSPSVTKQFGYTLEDITPNIAFNFIHPDDLAEFAEKRNHILKNPGESFSSLHRLRHKNGNWIWCSTTLTNLLDVPAVGALVSNFRDITEKHEMEQQLQFDKNNLDALINNTSDLLWSVDRNYKLITFNQPMYETIKKIRGKEILKECNILHTATTPEVSERYKSYYDKAFTGISFTEIENYNIQEEIWTEISFYPIRDGDKIIGTACQSHDITNRMRSEIQMKELNKSLQTQTKILIETESRYSNLFNMSPQPMWIFDAETFKFIQVNKAAIDTYGYSEEEFLSMSVLDIRIEKETTKENASNQIFNDDVSNNTFKHKNKWGEIIEVEIYNTPLSLNNSNFISVIIIDITEKNLQKYFIEKAIIKTQEEERYEIGIELHDNVCQILASSKMSLGMLKKSLTPTTTANYNQCMEQISHALIEIRNISHRLAPVFMENVTLVETFRILLNTFTINQDFKIITDYDEAVSNRALNQDLQLNLYRILQEQFRNIQTHSHATIIEIKVSIIQNKLTMSISDNGDGFDASASYVGIGFSNMKRRVKLFSGEFMVIASPGNGCKLIIEIPLAEIIDVSN